MIRDAEGVAQEGWFGLWGNIQLIKQATDNLMDQDPNLDPDDDYVRSQATGALVHLDLDLGYRFMCPATLEAATLSSPDGRRHVCLRVAELAFWI